MSKCRKIFHGFTEEEIKRAETNSFVIMIGQDFFCKDGDFKFSRQEAEKNYEKLLNNILRTLDEGTERQRVAAEKCLVSLHILPLRVQ